MVRRKSGSGRIVHAAGGAEASSARPATMRWSDLSADEQTALKRLNRGHYPGLDEGTAGRLLALGLAARRADGVGISRAGRELVIATLLAARQDISGDPA